MTMRILAFFMTIGSLVLSVGYGSLAQAGELDNESTVINEQAARAKELPGTVVVRVNEKTGEAAVLETSAALSVDDAGKNALLGAEFKALPKVAAELDQSSSTSSWFGWYPRGYYRAPVYYYAGYNYAYRTYYSYSWYGYSWYWYRWF
jgi:hypothetical protein